MARPQHLMVRQGGKVFSVAPNKLRSLIAERPKTRGRQRVPSVESVGTLVFDPASVIDLDKLSAREAEALIN